MTTTSISWPFSVRSLIFSFVISAQCSRGASGEQTTAWRASLAIELRDGHDDAHRKQDQYQGSGKRNGSEDEEWQDEEQRREHPGNVLRHLAEVEVALAAAAERLRERAPFEPGEEYERLDEEAADEHERRQQHAGQRQERMPVGEEDHRGGGARDAHQHEQRHHRDDERGAPLQVLAEALRLPEARVELHRVPEILLERQVLRERGVDWRLRGLSIWRRHLGLPVYSRRPAYEPPPAPAATISALSPN